MIIPSLLRSNQQKVQVLSKKGETKGSGKSKLTKPNNAVTGNAVSSINKNHAFLGIRKSDCIMAETNQEDFYSKFSPNDMRLLALVSHNNMKASMKEFVIAHKHVLKKFRLTGTNSTMTMLREVFENDSEVVYGPSCASGPLGGDAQLVALAVTGQLGGCIFFRDPMESHAHSADIECLSRQCDVHNIMVMSNPATAHLCLGGLRVALEVGQADMIPSFFVDMKSPTVIAYERKQKAIIESHGRSKVSVRKVEGEVEHYDV